MVKMIAWNVLIMNNIVMCLFIFRHPQRDYPNHHRMKSVWTKLGEDDINWVDEKLIIRCHLLAFILRSIKNTSMFLIYIDLTSRNFLATRCNAVNTNLRSLLIPRSSGWPRPPSSWGSPRSGPDWRGSPRTRAGTGSASARAALCL